MEHWFDGLVKELAGAPSRRSFLGGIFATLGASAFGVAPGARGLASTLPRGAAAPLPQTRTDRRGSCTLEVVGQDSTVHHSVQSTFNGKALTHKMEVILTRPERRGQAPHITSTRTITLGNDPLIHIEKDSREGSTQVKLTYGSAFQGIREASYTTDGKMIEGTIDGQRIAPLPIGADPKSLKLADGRKAPIAKLDPILETALDDILKKAKDDIATCTREEPGRASFGRRQDRSGYASNRPPASDPETGFGSRLKAFLPMALAPVSFLSSLFSPDVVHASGESSASVGSSPDPFPPQSTIPQNSSACQSCQNTCAYTEAGCEIGACAASAACFIFAGVCCAGALATCNIAGGICLNNCNSPGTITQPGGACCPVGCPNVDGCCYQNQQCSGTANVCCAVNVVVCEGACCPPGYICKEGVCCTPDRPVCHGVCCPQGHVCSNEKICCRQLALNTEPVSCSGTCCAEGQKCAKPGPNSEPSCCPTEHICGDTCCPNGCVDGNKCRPLCLIGVPCGASCCDWGCDNAATSTCKKPQNCPKGQSVCSENQSGVPKVCCPDGTGCLGGKCCPTNTVNCTNKTNGVMGCWPKSQCAATPPPPQPK